nr:hypothetical protein [Paludibacteraceae bacterium]
LPKLTECGEGSSIPAMKAGDIIMANGTQVVVDSVSYPQAGDSSIISGTGHICFPIIKNIQMKMKFENIKINCAKELVKGKILSVYDEKTCAMINIDDLTGENSQGGSDNSSSDANTKPYNPDNSKNEPAGQLMLTEDSTVMFKLKDKDEAVAIGKAVTMDAQQYQTKNYLSDNTHYIEFFNEDPTNAFDNDFQGYYRKMSKYEYFDAPNNKVILPWLANNPGKLKKIKAREMKKKETIEDFDSVMFVIPSGNFFIQLNAKKNGNGTYEIDIPGLEDVDHSTPIFAIARNKDATSFFDAGKLMQANYKERTHKLIIVPTREEYTVDVNKIKEQLDAIYGRVGVTYEVVEDRSFVNDEVANAILENGLDINADEESRWSVESGEMKLIREMYTESHPNMDKKAAYLFLVNHAEAPYESVEGDMPRNQSVGYIFMNNNKKLDDGHVVAHEIGHGVYKFQHTKDYGLPEKSTDNLMDYNNGDFLAHYQWRVMQDSVMFVWKVLQDDEDGLWTTDGHYYLFTYIGMRMGLLYNTAKKYGIAAEKPDTYVLTQEDINNGYVVLGKNEKIPLKDVIKGSSVVGDKLTKGNIVISRPVSKITVDGRYFFIPTNVYEWPDHTINEVDFKRGYIEIGKDGYGRPQRIYFIRGLKEGDMLENITWLVGGTQQKYHSLTGGYHGVELAVTAYMIAKCRNSHKDDFWGYLLHRFGDSFAHMEMDNDEKGFDKTNKLQEYIDAVNEYLEKKLAHIDFTTEKLEKPIVRNYKEYSIGSIKMNVRTNLKKEDVIWRMLQSVIKCSDDNELEDLDPEAYLINSSFEFDDIRDGILKKLEDKMGKKDQFKYIMYNGPTPNLDIYAGSFTLGHGWSICHPDGKDVDNILMRKDLFDFYLRKSVELFKIMDVTKGEKNINEDAIATEDEIIAEINKIIEIADKATTNKAQKLDATFAFHIYILRVEEAKKNNEKIGSFNIPIKILADDVRGFTVDASVRPYYYFGSGFKETDEFNGKVVRNTKEVEPIVKFIDNYLKVNEELTKKIEGFKIRNNSTEYIITPIYR